MSVCNVTGREGALKSVIVGGGAVVNRSVVVGGSSAISIGAENPMER